MNIFKSMKTCLYRIKDKVQLDKAIDMADNARVQSKQRFYVMPSSDGKLIVMDRKNFRLLKQKHYIERKANVDDLIMESFYFTPYADGSGELSEGFRKKKLESYYSWCDARRELKAKQKKTKRNEKKETGSNRNSNADK